MGTNIEDQLCEILRNTSFSLQLDETTTSDNNALLMAYVHYLSDENIVEKLVFCKCKHFARNGQTIPKVKQYFRLCLTTCKTNPFLLQT